MGISAPIAFIASIVIVPFFVLLAFVAFVPAGFLALPDGIVSALATAFSIGLMLEDFIPMQTLINAILFVYTVDIVIFAWRAFAWMIGIVTGAGR